MTTLASYSWTLGRGDDQSVPAETTQNFTWEFLVHTLWHGDVLGKAWTSVDLMT